jgi:pantetheine-phosphate adenylyltransferase
MKERERIAIYPGSFDPITLGHIDIIKRAILLFDQVIVAAAVNIHKEPFFNVDERMEMIRESVRSFPQVVVDSFDGLLVDYAKRKKASAVIRGLRAVSDFEYEFQMSLVNRKMDEELVTVFLMTHDKYSYLNSSIVKELARFDADISSFVPLFVKEKILEKLRKNEDH